MSSFIASPKWQDVKVSEKYGPDKAPVLHVGRFAEKDQMRSDEQVARNIRILEPSYDELTGLASPAVLDAIVHHVLRRARRDGEFVTLLCIDIEGMNDINERFGRKYGDSLLLHFGELLHRELRQSDVVARTGGDEFAVLLPQTDSKQAVVVIEHILASIYQGNEDGSHPYLLSVRIGRCTSDPSLEISSLQEMLTTARSLLEKIETLRLR